MVGNAPSLLNLSSDQKTTRSNFLLLASSNNRSNPFRLLTPLETTTLDTPIFDFVSVPTSCLKPVYQETIYQSPFPTAAGQIHFDEVSGLDNYFAHVRSQDIDGGVRQILEIQSDLFQQNAPDELKAYKNIWHERVIREELLRAKKDSVTELWFPTKETVAGIQGFSFTGTLPRDCNVNDMVESNKLTYQILSKGSETAIVALADGIVSLDSWDYVKQGEIELLEDQIHFEPTSFGLPNNASAEDIKDRATSIFDTDYPSIEDYVNSAMQDPVNPSFVIGEPDDKEQFKKSGSIASSSSRSFNDVRYCFSNNLMSVSSHFGISL